MTVSDLEASARDDDAPPPDLAPRLRALWLARAGRWHEAHDLCQDIAEPDGAWIHAYLHREEGDLGNAAYWYARARRNAPGPEVSLEEEWRAIASAFV
ncbi:MAG: hypothetical protein HKN82_11340 [Akkermansiaceae bacterium]|nr:hypothetical protein [Akkermansiaceae bacterium]NNM29914.1 hypothetical protein [Akkermansiaceae bacterium]